MTADNSEFTLKILNPKGHGLRNGEDFMRYSINMSEEMPHGFQKEELSGLVIELGDFVARSAVQSTHEYYQLLKVGAYLLRMYSLCLHAEKDDVVH